MPQNIDEILKKYNEDVKRHIDVLKEDFTSQVKGIGEQYDSIIERLDSHDTKFTSIEKKLTEHDVKFASIESRLLNIEKNIEIMKVDISFIKTSLKQKADLEEFQALEKRVAILEAQAT